MAQLQAIPGPAPDLRRILEEAIEAVPDALGAEAVAIVEGATGWPVRTGASRAGFAFAYEGAGLLGAGDTEVALTNTEPYAPYVEARTGAARRALAAAEDALAAAADRAIDGRLRRRIGSPFG